MRTAHGTTASEFVDSRMQVVCYATADWDAQLWTNKQHLMDRLSRAGVQVVYVDSLGLRSPGLGGADVRRLVGRLRNWRPVARAVQPDLWRDSPLVIPWRAPAWQTLNTLLLRGRLARNKARLRLAEDTVIWAFNPTVVGFVPSSWPIVYHCVDDLASFPGIDPVAFRAAEKDMVARAAASIASSRPLVEHLEALGAEDVIYWPNPADVESFAAVRPNLPGARPVIGFAGAVQSHKVDLDLIAGCARLRPEWDFELVGPVGHGLASTGADVDAVRVLPSNVRLTPAVNRRELPEVLARFAAGIIPYKINDYTRSVYPMKVFEYLASGMPVVSTPLPSLLGEVEHVRFAATPQGFVEALDDLIRAGRAVGEPATLERQRYASDHSWSLRTAEALALLHRVRTP